MKKMCCIALVVGLLLTVTGCGEEKPQSSEENHCSLKDEKALPRYDISVATPANAPELETFQGEGCQVFAQEDGDFYFAVQTLQADSLDALLMELTGKQQNSMTILTTWQQGMPRHDLNWVSAGESGLEVNRAAIIDDGSYYYTVTLTVPEDNAAEIFREQEDCFDSIWLTENQESELTAP